MRKLTLIAYALLILANRSFAQDPHFSQFFASPMTLNPAFTGKFDGTFRAAGNYRNQWPTINRAYQTATLSVDAPIMQSHIADNDRWGLGGMGFTDKSANGAVAFNYFSLSTAYHKGLDEDGYQQLSLGFQATYANMMINTSQLKFEDQLTTSGFTGVSSEIFSGNTLKSNYLDLNAGILYSGSTSDQNNFYAGISVYHINRPKQQFTGALYLLDPRVTFQAGGYFPVGYATTLHLSAMTSSQAKANETLLGGALQIEAGGESMEKPVSFYVGAWARMKDAIIPYIGLEVSDFRLGVTYDVNTSSLKTGSSGRGGMEVSLIYTCRPSERKSLPCPKF